MFKGSTENDRFFVFDAGGLLHFHPSFFYGFGLALGGGGEMWLGHQKEAILHARIEYRFGTPLFGLVDRITLGASVIPFALRETDQLKLGVGFRF